MKRLIIAVIALLILVLAGSRFDEKGDVFSLEDLFDYQKEFVAEEIPACSLSPVKTYMSYKSITDPRSKQYRFIEANMSVDKSGLLLDKDGFIGVALGSYFGAIGERYYFTLDNGTILPLVKIDEKADVHTFNGCQHRIDGSVIEFVIDSTQAREFFGQYGNGLVASGNFDNIDFFHGSIAKVERVGDEEDLNRLTFLAPKAPDNNKDVFFYESGY